MISAEIKSYTRDYFQKLYAQFSKQIERFDESIYPEPTLTLVSKTDHAVANTASPQVQEDDSADRGLETARGMALMILINITAAKRFENQVLAAPSSYYSYKKLAREFEEPI